MAAAAAGKPTVWGMVNEAVQSLGPTTNATVREWVWKRHTEVSAQSSSQPSDRPQVLDF